MNAFTKAKPATLFDTSVRDQRPVLAVAPLRPGFVRDDLSRYGDPSWDLQPGVFRENARRCHTTVHFHSVDDPVIAEALRELLYARLNIELIGYKARLPPACVRQVFNRSRRFFEFVRQDLGVFDLAQVNQALLDRYAKALQATTLRPIVMAQLLEVVFHLYAWREHLPAARLLFEPWPGRSPYWVAGHRSQKGENLTPRIPESVMEPLLAWSIRYVTTFAPDILAARNELTSLEDRRDAMIAADAPLVPTERRALYRRRVAAYLEERRHRGRGVPIWTTAHNGVMRHDLATGLMTPPVNWLLIHLHAGIDAQADPASHLSLTTGAPDLIAAAIDTLGVESGGMDTPISRDSVTSPPWRSRFDAKTLASEERMLQAACYVVCAYLTGMRDCEVQAMRVGCLSLSRSEDGIIERYRIRSVAYKGRAASGEPAEWVTISPVAEAIRILERLATRANAARGTDTLWPVLVFRRTTKSHVSAEIVRQLNEFRDHLNGVFGTEAEPAVPMHPTGTPWRITTRQFRRTIAWHIANRPFGTIAGMIQYKHASVAAFEGYAGASPSSFRAEVDAERRLGQLDDIVTYFDDRQAGHTLSGPAASRINRTLDAVTNELEPLPGMIADRARLRTLLASTARTLHVGVLADCFFDPAMAMCLNEMPSRDRTGPLISLCQPTRCPNACITAHHKPAWKQAADNARELLHEKRLSGLQRIVLSEELVRLDGVLDGVGVAPQDRLPHGC